MSKTINCGTFRKMVLVGAKQLESNRAKVDALNVFPVPDGDTGTNMSLTMQSGAELHGGKRFSCRMRLYFQRRFARCAR